MPTAPAPKRTVKSRAKTSTRPAARPTTTRAKTKKSVKPEPEVVEEEVIDDEEPDVEEVEDSLDDAEDDDSTDEDEDASDEDDELEEEVVDEAEDATEDDDTFDDADEVVEDDDPEFYEGDSDIITKYRPKRIDELIGQRGARKSLATSISKAGTSSFGHTYMFSGTHGSGKTTSARIFAAAINCENKSEDDPINPCGVCRQCDAIFSGRNTSAVEEINCSDRNGIDDMREIFSRVATSVSSNYKVIIFDEAQNMTASSQSLALKYIEEPGNSQVIFIFCTTDPQKIKNTILSRSTKIYFDDIDVDSLSELVVKVAASEDINIDEGEIESIARLGNGSARDCLRLLDAYRLGVKDGSLDLSLELIESIIDRDLSRAFTSIATFEKERVEGEEDSIYVHTNPVSILSILTSFWRDCLIYQAAPELCKLPSHFADATKSIAESYSQTEIMRNLSFSSNAHSQAMISTFPRIVLEGCIASLMRKNAKDRIDRLEDLLDSLSERLDTLLESGVPVSGATKPSSSRSKKADPDEDESVDDEESQEKGARKIEEFGKNLDKKGSPEPEDDDDEPLDEDDEIDDAGNGDEETELTAALLGDDYGEALDILVEFGEENFKARDKRHLTTMEVVYDEEEETPYVLTRLPLSESAQQSIRDEAVIEVKFAKTKDYYGE